MHSLNAFLGFCAGAAVLVAAAPVYSTISEPAVTVSDSSDATKPKTLPMPRYETINICLEQTEIRDRKAKAYGHKMTVCGKGAQITVPIDPPAQAPVPATITTTATVTTGGGPKHAQRTVDGGSPATAAKRSETEHSITTTISPGPEHPLYTIEGSPTAIGPLITAQAVAEKLKSWNDHWDPWNPPHLPTMLEGPAVTQAVQNPSQLDARDIAPSSTYDGPTTTITPGPEHPLYTVDGDATGRISIPTTTAEPSPGTVEPAAFDPAISVLYEFLNHAESSSPSSSEAPTTLLTTPSPTPEEPTRTTSGVSPEMSRVIENAFSSFDPERFESVVAGAPPTGQEV